MRKDLGMRKGKMIAQGAHASMKVLLDMMYYDQINYDPPNSIFGSVLEYRLDSAIGQWLNGPFAKICVYVESERELLDLYQKAKDAGIPCSLITDAGRTEFKKTCPICDETGWEECINCDGEARDGIGQDCDGGRMTCRTCNGAGKVPNPTNTCIAIGPDYPGKIDPITSHLKLL